MFGADLSGLVHYTIFFVFLYPLFFASVFSALVWPAVFGSLVVASPHRGKIKWWVMMPVACFAACIGGSLLAGLALWLPTLYLYDFCAPAFREINKASIFYFGTGASAAALVGASLARRLDEALHRN